MRAFRSVFLLFFCFSLTMYSQKKSYVVRTIAFYNVENLFDTINDPKKFDDDRTPTGADNWTSERYNDHILKISSVIARIGASTTGSLPDFVGLAEVENKEVVEDLVNSQNLREANYGIIHFNSPDARGIDVAFLYKKDLFKVLEARKFPLVIYEKGTQKRRYTRDQLLVSGEIEGEVIHFIVNHWPSRSGGEAASRPYREEAARLNLQIINELLKINPEAKIVSMGDFNDDPTNSSFKRVLKTQADRKKLQPGQLFNPMEKLYKSGVGSLAYRDSWSLFDQMVFSYGFVQCPITTYRYWKTKVFNDAMVVSSSGQYAGYPFRSYSNGNYTGGYSDHFPVYSFIIKEVEQ